MELESLLASVDVYVVLSHRSIAVTACVISLQYQRGYLSMEVNHWSGFLAVSNDDPAICRTALSTILRSSTLVASISHFSKWVAKRSSCCD